MLLIFSLSLQTTETWFKFVKGMAMGTFHEEAAMAHGVGNPMWNVTYLESVSGKEITVEVRASERQEAVNKATQRLDMDLSKPEGGVFRPIIRAFFDSHENIWG